MEGTHTSHQSAKVVTSSLLILIACFPTNPESSPGQSWMSKGKSPSSSLRSTRNSTPEGIWVLDLKIQLDDFSELMAKTFAAWSDAVWFYSPGHDQIKAQRTKCRGASTGYLCASWGTLTTYTISDQRFIYCKMGKLGEGLKKKR